MSNQPYPNGQNTPSQGGGSYTTSDYNPMEYYNQQEYPQAGPSRNNYTTQDFNPNDRNQNYRPSMANSGRLNSQQRNPFRMASNNFKKYKYKKNHNNVNRSRKLTDSVTPNENAQTQSTPIGKKNPNPRNKGLAITVTRDGNETIKVILNKIADDLQIDLKTIKSLAFDKVEHGKIKVFMFFHDSLPYTKVIEKMEAQENALLEGDNNADRPKFFYEGPKDLNGPFIGGEIYSTVRICAQLFPLKLTRSNGEAKLIEGLDMLEEWRSTRFSENVKLIEEKVHAIRISHENMHFTFRDEKLSENFLDLMGRCLTQYIGVKDTLPTVVAISQGLTPRAKRNFTKVTPDVMKICQILGNLTPQTIEWFRLISTGKYALVEIENDSALEEATKRLNEVKMSTDTDMDTGDNFLDKLPPPITPIKKH
jgi:hypothetical protein